VCVSPVFPICICVCEIISFCTCLQTLYATEMEAELQASEVLQSYRLFTSRCSAKSIPAVLSDPATHRICEVALATGNDTGDSKEDSIVRNTSHKMHIDKIPGPVRSFEEADRGAPPVVAMSQWLLQTRTEALKAIMAIPPSG